MVALMVCLVKVVTVINYGQTVIRSDLNENEHTGVCGENVYVE